MAKPRIAAIVTEYRPRSHADVIVGKLLAGYQLDGQWTESRVEVAALYLDQVPANDLGRALAAEYGVPIYDTIGEAVAFGGDGAGVAGVVLVGEHGHYPTNELGQKLYPRRRFFDAAVAAMVGSGRRAPIFTDKHLSWSFDHASRMVNTARRLGIPLLAGSSLPVTWRRPYVSWPLAADVDEALVLGYGDLEAYGFHALETLQCMVERRRGGETGVRTVQCLEGDAVWQAGREGRWSEALLDAALETVERRSDGSIESSVPNPAAFLIEYRDGFRAAVLMLDGLTQQFAFAARRVGQIEACCFFLQSPEPFGHFTLLVRQIEELMLTGQPPYPVERTLLTTGILDAAMRSRHAKHVALDTPELAIAYAAPTTDWGAAVERW
jgi:hypothetical protein